MFGQDFERFGIETEEETPHTKDAASSASAAVDKAKKGKLVAKSTGHTYQFQIMESIGIPREDIKKFADPYFWLEFFPPICKVR